MQDSHAELELAVAAAIEALDRRGPDGLAAFLASQGSRAAEVRRILGRVTALGVLDPLGAVLPARLGPYRLVRELGRGGMGVVHEVVDESLGRRLALKMVRPELLVAPGARERFAREIAAVVTLSHPAIAPIVGAGEENGLPFYVMPLLHGVAAATAIDRLAGRAPSTVTGADLRKAIDASLANHADPDRVFTGALWAAAVRLVRQAALGIAHAHAHGIVHRDLKPSNLMLLADGRAMIVDFGLAQLRGSERLTRTGHEPGSPAYMAPEQLRGQPADERTDVYGLGVTLWHLATLTPPYPDADPQELRQRILAGQPSSPPRGALPPALRHVLCQAIDRDRERRYPTAAAFADDLAAILDGRTIAATRLPLPVRLRRYAERHRALAGGALALGLLVPLALLALLLRETSFTARLQHEKGRADAALRDYELLAGLVHAQRAVTSAAELFPATPALAPALRRWQEEDAARVIALRGAAEQALGRLEPTSGPLSPAQQFLRDALLELQRRITALEAAECPDVRLRQRWADQVGGLTRHHPNARVSWDEIRTALAAADGVRSSTSYAGADIELHDEELVGLVPLGANPVTKLLEFYDLRSAWDGATEPRDLPIPAHQPDGSIPVDESTGIVFVLLPGGRVELGSQATDPQGAHFDPAALPDEARHALTLAPFLLARHELTQAQWRRLWTWDAALRTPSTYPAGLHAFGRTITAAHPVENVDWAAADLLLRRHGMVLPTEAQWEYACRANTAIPWPVPRERLVGFANLADATTTEFGANWAVEPWRDGFAVHAPVGSFAANAFGLFDAIGNVFEWCRDEYGPPTAARRPGDGLCERGDGSGARTVRGGSFSRTAVEARSSARGGVAPGMRFNDFGVRAARELGRVAGR